MAALLRIKLVMYKLAGLFLDYYSKQTHDSLLVNSMAEANIVTVILKSLNIILFKKDRMWIK